MSKVLINFSTKTIGIVPSRLAKLPEHILHSSIRNGDKSILHIKMNECKSAIIKQDGITTVFTDQLTGCNSICVIAKSHEGNPIVIMAHAMPTNNSITTQCNNIDTELKRYEPIIDKNSIISVFYNVNERNSDNPVFNSVRNVLNRHFGRNYKETVVKYQPIKNPSTGNIYEFEPNNLNQIRITYVGQKSDTMHL